MRMGPEPRMQTFAVAHGDFVFRRVGGIVVGRGRFEFGGAGVDHLVGRDDAPFLALFADFLPGLAHIAGDDFVGKAHLLGLAQQVFRQGFLLEHLLHLHDVLDLFQEPLVDLRDVVNFFNGAPRRMYSAMAKRRSSS